VAKESAPDSWAKGTLRKCSSREREDEKRETLKEERRLMNGKRKGNIELRIHREGE